MIHPPQLEEYHFAVAIKVDSYFPGTNHNPTPDNILTTPPIAMAAAISPKAAPLVSTQNAPKTINTEAVILSNILRIFISCLLILTVHNIYHNIV